MIVVSISGRVDTVPDNKSASAPLLKKSVKKPFKALRFSYAASRVIMSSAKTPGKATTKSDKAYEKMILQKDLRPA